MQVEAPERAKAQDKEHEKRTLRDLKVSPSIETPLCFSGGYLIK